MNSHVFTTHGRVEIGGNHTDHQHGLVLAATVSLQVWGNVTPNYNNIININSSPFPDISIDLKELDVKESEKGTTSALVRGVAAWFVENGHEIGGFDANISSNIPVGSGLSSSAAFEVLVGRIFKDLYNAKVTPMDIALAGQYAENKYFGKPCGLMDQAVISFGGLCMIDFMNPEKAVVTQMNASFDNYLLCVVDTGTSHADLTPKYSAIPHEMIIVAGHFGKDYLRDVEPEVFYREVGRLRKSGMSDRAILRAMHFFEENERVKKQVEALKKGKMQEFLGLVNESGRSSLAYLQNVFAASDAYRQGLTLALALSEKVLNGKGAWRVHGGGFAGTILAIVPKTMKSNYEKQICKVFGEKACHFLTLV